MDGSYPAEEIQMGSMLAGILHLHHTGAEEVETGIHLPVAY